MRESERESERERERERERMGSESLSSALEKEIIGCKLREYFCVFITNRLCVPARMPVHVRGQTPR